MSNNWKELLRPEVVEKMDDNAKFKDGVPNIAAITRAGIRAELTNKEIQEEVLKIHENGTPIHCIVWYRSNLGARKTSKKNVTQEALDHFFATGGVIEDADLVQLAKDNMLVIYTGRGNNLEAIAKYGIVEKFEQHQLDEKAKKQEERSAKQAAKQVEAAAKNEKKEANKAVAAAVAEVAEGTKSEVANITPAKTKVAKLKKKA